MWEAKEANPFADRPQVGDRNRFPQQTADIASAIEPSSGNSSMRLVASSASGTADAQWQP
jgi:hypothetical protein